MRRNECSFFVAGALLPSERPALPRRTGGARRFDEAPSCHRWAALKIHDSRAAGTLLDRWLIGDAWRGIHGQRKNRGNADHVHPRLDEPSRVRRMPGLVRPPRGSAFAALGQARSRSCVLDPRARRPLRAGGAGLLSLAWVSAVLEFPVRRQRSLRGSTRGVCAPTNAVRKVR
jgi:hypothetical protein